MTGIFDRLSADLRAMGEPRLGDQLVRQICNEYDDVLSALDRMAKSPDAATDRRYRMLTNLQEELEEEMTQLLLKH